MRENLTDCLIVVKPADGDESTEVEIDGSAMVGNLDQEASISMLIGQVVRKMLLTRGEGQPIEITYYST